MKTAFPWNKVHCSSLEHICNSNINNWSAIFQCRVSGKELQGLKMHLMTQIKQNITNSNNEWQNTSVGFVVLIAVFLMGYNTTLLGKWFLMFCEIVVPSSLHQILGTTCQTTKCHIPQDLSLKNISNYTVHKNAVHMCCFRHVHWVAVWQHFLHFFVLASCTAVPLFRLVDWNR